MKYPDKEEVEGSFNLNIYISNHMHTLFYSTISDFDENLEGMLDDGRYNTTINNMHKLGWKSQLFKSADVLVLFHGCGVSQYPCFYYRTKNIYQMLPRPYVGS